MAEKRVSKKNLKRFAENIKTNANVLKRDYSYNIDETVSKGQVILKCTTAGTTEKTSLNLTGVSVGSTLTDGTVEWEVISITGYGTGSGGGGGTSISEWTSSTSYSVGDLVIYNDLIWRCITAHTSTSVFDVQKWVRISDGDSIVYSDLAIGATIPHMGTTPPREFLACDGTVYNITSYTELAEYINEQFGSYDYFGGDGTTTFAVPDLRGEFLRGTGTNSHTNQGSGANVGVHQDGTEIPFIVAYHNSNLLTYEGTSETGPVNYDSVTRTATGYTSYGKNGSGSTSDNALVTTRPTNTSVLYCIKYTNTTNTIIHSGMKYETLWEGEAGNLSGVSSDIAINLSESLKRYQKFGVQVKCSYGPANRYYYREFDVSSFINWLSTTISNEQQFSISWGYSNADDFVDFSHISTDVQLMFGCRNSIITKVIGISEGVQIPTGVQAARITLWEGWYYATNPTVAGATNTQLLTDSLDNYDQLEISVVAGGQDSANPAYPEKSVLLIDVSDIIYTKNGTRLSVFANTDNYGSINIGFPDSTHFALVNLLKTFAYFGVTKIVGIKYIQPDSYSTVEKLIGTWIDGKPLYRKVFTNVSDGYSTGLTSSSYTIIKYYGIIHLSEHSVIIPQPYENSYRITLLINSDGTVSLLNNAMSSSPPMSYMAVEYTKN